MDTHREIDALMEKAASVLKGKKVDAIVALCEKVLSLLAIIGLVVYNVSIKPMNVGVHFDNRYGLGIKADYMQKLAAKIFRSGFRWSACVDAICSEEDDGHRIGLYTMKLQKRSSSMHPAATYPFDYRCTSTCRLRLSMLDLGTSV